MSQIDDFHFYLEPHETQTVLWRRLEEQLRLRLESERARLEDPRLTHEQTCACRGKIAALREFLGFADRPVPMRNVQYSSAADDSDMLKVFEYIDRRSQ